MTITLGSLFDGSGGFPLAGALCGIVPLWASEIEPYPIAVTKSRFPEMKHLGDISKINGAEINPVDIITFGSPCQDLSVAGKRAGLKHEVNGDNVTTRSGLFMEAVRIIKEMRCATNGKYPRFALWENVPGAFSSNKGEDFRVVLEELIKISEAKATVPSPPKSGWPYADAYVGDGWSLAYRTFDAQYWGVPQRRRRIYLVADFAGGCATRILFEREGLRGYFAEGKSPWQGVAAHAQGSARTDGCKRNCLTSWDYQTRRVYDSVGKWPTLSAGAITSGQNQQAVLQSIESEATGFDGYNSTLTEDKSATLGVNCGMSTGRCGVIQPKSLETIDVETEVTVRKFKVDKDALRKLLRKHKGSKTNNEIAQALNKPLTLVEHWFRNDKSFAVPDEDVWFELKKLLGITTTEYDQSITQFQVKNNNYDLRNRIYASETSPTLTCGCGHHLHLVPEATSQPLVLFEPRSQDGVPRIHKEISPTLNTAQGGQRQPCVAAPLTQYPFCKSSRPSFKGDSEKYIDCKVSNTLNTFDLGDKRANELIVETVPVYCIQGNCIDRSDNAGCNGKGWREDASFTLNTIDRPAIVFAVDQGGGKSGANFHFDTSPTLTCTHGGEPAVVFCMASGQAHAEVLENRCPTLNCTAEQPIVTEQQTAKETDTYAMTTGSFMQICKDLSPTLAARDYKAPNVAGYWDGTQVYGQSSFATYIEGVSATLRASGGDLGGGSENLVRTQYIVRRLTPVECARLQGFADGWGVPEYKEDFSDEEYRFWLDVRNNYAVINGRKEKEYTKPQMLTWYNKLHSDSSEYKMWGNGIALPTALYCMQGICEAITK